MDDAPDLAVAFASAIEEERRRNARWLLSTARVFLYGAFVVVLAILGATGGSVQGRQTPLVAVGFAVSIVLWIAARMSDRILGLAWYSLALFDVPFGAAIDWITLPLDRRPYETLQFMLALNLVQLMCAQLALQLRVVITTAVVVSIAFTVLAFRCPVFAVAGWATGLILIALDTALSAFLARRTRVLVQQTAEKQALRERVGRYFSPAVAGRIMDSVPPSRDWRAPRAHDPVRRHPRLHLPRRGDARRRRGRPLERVPLGDGRGDLPPRRDSRQVHG